MKKLILIFITILSLNVLAVDSEDVDGQQLPFLDKEFSGRKTSSESPDIVKPEFPSPRHEQIIEDALYQDDGGRCSGVFLI